ncbi:MAG: Asp-tRNA(Asn)/Glu-tRNA(Gln) amidotransferase subunit GatC [Meiothermus sp.]|uniref:Asp-tRNA(Asn)/Glu-tRNA(Gln) amidotransferase subunit GatC n=1 Tax=Meiothermus sp. TaxID=1955249 RepID=UPI0025CCB94A|nr:Asp-tRNA(Asn)/Glu-tRNA(Gln) amidotransferase subunit GatC [Meiothermus sp.]MCS7057517.1 Asp-tRNA(Asn)/Glu-tRNA(Gln) amidotransferase subunit GatC [Meiothermus sp.]MCS7193706.1 Asp-tRNA(Asn)/Glu-tRNA(Gln) amidotransferase subunit GatC [Meiothermus sp.]MCX7740550.1 Asp-tRNA(Asn)/Glu-tRNA(Gln) amidotransferase subunit GatC [Meiothermus sp.]MDW8089939.1 Asp-tRNA(Asn)/Glu-tRNA(Gln) amidotransferase subunit GatC [Meiothermus sp.]MDW8481636.1 Asp-tRNA(Asn)/Glu-tRNA(Gln) amidotransferase subunit Ga
MTPVEITPELLERLSRLARLSLEPEEARKLEGELRSIVNFFEQLQELDTQGLPEMARPIGLTNRLRPDQVQPSLAQQEALSVAIEEEDGQFKVPRVIE